tara:strand:- start:324 stop:515 length:192 start_codon:yes stop_codon:yes gene_type:complete
MNEIVETLENIERQLHEAAEDALKFDQGNNSAGTRVRKAMQNIKGLAQQVRLEVQAQKNGVPA